jgi:predicted glutamine amidotransferase
MDHLADRVTMAGAEAEVDWAAEVILMCRLFGMHAGASPLPATFWLIDAPDSLSAQSHRNPDGAGIGAFGADGTPQVDKQPLAAWEDPEFASAARELRGTTFVAHVRYASIGAHTIGNTHPFLQHGRLFAHNGVVEGLAELEARLGELDAAGLVHGETDSERVLALITGETARHAGDLSRGLVAAIGWISERLPVYALNLVLCTSTDLWALRYPATHELYVLARPAGGTGTSRDLDAKSARIHARSRHLADQPSVIIASERMDDDPAWRLLEPGELLHVSADLTVASSTPLPAVPRHLLQRAQLDPVIAASQHPAVR